MRRAEGNKNDHALRSPYAVVKVGHVAPSQVHMHVTPAFPLVVALGSYDVEPDRAAPDGTHGQFRSVRRRRREMRVLARVGVPFRTRSSLTSTVHIEPGRVSRATGATAAMASTTDAVVLATVVATLPVSLARTDTVSA